MFNDRTRHVRYARIISVNRFREQYLVFTHHDNIVKRLLLLVPTVHATLLMYDIGMCVYARVYCAGLGHM